jgi:hypothetical protein
MPELCVQPLWNGWRAAKCHCQAAGTLLHINIKTSSTLLPCILLKSAKFNITREREILFTRLIILLGHSNSGVPQVTITSKVVVYSPPDRAEAFLLSPLSPFVYLGQMLGWTCESVQRKFCPVLQYSLQREERQRGEEKTLLWPRRCCCVLARCLGHELKCSFLVMAYSMLFNNVFEAHFLHLCRRNAATWQQNLAPLKNTEFWVKFCHGWPLAISITSCKVQMLYASSLC